MAVSRMAIAVVGLAGCASVASSLGGRDRAREEAEELAAAAESSCRGTLTSNASLSYIREQVTEFERLAAAAEEKDPKVWERGEPIRGRARADIRSRCPGQIKEALAAAEQREADRLAKHQGAQAKKQARLAELRTRLKGDRLRVFDAQGEPFRFEGAVESSPFWRYAVSIGDGAEEVDCTVTYTFRGDKIAKKEVARYCPNDPHPGTGP